MASTALYDLKLSRSDLVSATLPPRWSTFGAPSPTLAVNIQTEQDVQAVVRYCAANDIPFVVQGGGYGWASTFSHGLSNNGVLINVAGLNSVTFNDNRTVATIGGGTTIQQTIDAAHAANTLVVTGNCNGVGALGSMLAGGFGALMGQYGFSVDNIISLRVVTADGEMHDNVSADSEPDLFWAMKGAGANLGIVTSAQVKAHPAKSDDDLKAWSGALIFSPDKLKQVAQAVNDVNLTPEMYAFMYFASSGPPAHAPVVMATVFLQRGSVEAGHAAFSSLYDLEPMMDFTAVHPYNQWNAGGDAFCIKGGRKPGRSVAVSKIQPAVWCQVWDKYVAFQSKPTAHNSCVILESYPLDHANRHATDTAFVHRKANMNAIFIPWYEDEALDEEAQAVGREVIQLLKDGDDLAKTTSYINFSFGDEDSNVLYGSSLERLRTIKQKYDPQNRFNQWFSIK